MPDGGHAAVGQEVVYDSRNSNDRLLLGLKGSLNEYELDLLRQRSQEARRQKAARGELVVAAPVGYIKTADQRLEKDPDLRVQEAIQLTYRKFFELGTVRQTMLWMVDQGLDLPVTRHTWAGRGDGLEAARLQHGAEHSQRSGLCRGL